MVTVFCVCIDCTVKVINGQNAGESLPVDPISAVFSAHC